MALTVVTAEVIDRDCVEVIANGPKGGQHIFQVHYRRDVLTHGYQEKPAKGYLKPAEIPQEILVAANRVDR